MGDRNLHPDGHPAAYVRNGAHGIVTAVHPGRRPDEDRIEVAFDGLGTIRIPRSFFDEHTDQWGRTDVGIDHAYAVTSYAVEGLTFDQSTSHVDPQSTRPEVYVDITRGRNENHVFVTPADDALDGERLPAVPAPDVDQQLETRLSVAAGEPVAIDLDPEAGEVALAWVGGTGRSPDRPPNGIDLPIGEHTRTEALDGWSRLEGLSYIEAILTLGGQLADGLGHAHRRGILHRDLKPANVLLTDDGRAMLLDFNLAEDVKLRQFPERASIGGTLPFMAPEHIEAYRTGTGRLDERCDLYSLGVILFELITGRHPFPIYKQASPENILAMVADRRKPPPRLRTHNTAVSPAVEALVRKCLAPDPADRYSSADELREDIDRHLANRPLKHAANPSKRELVRKWVKRHPRLASSSTVAAVAAILLAAVIGGAIYAREQSRGLEARGRLADHRTAFSDAQLFLDDRNRSWPRLDESTDEPARRAGALRRAR